MFEATHILISRHQQQTPVRLEAGGNRFKVYTEQEWLEKREPAFEMDAKLGLFCRGVQVVGFQLQPIAVKEANHPQAQATT
jgi:hypothetical protein